MSTILAGPPRAVSDAKAPAGSVAVIITAKNAETTIGKAVSTALAQGPAAEVVVVDDASTDGTSEAAVAADDGSGRLKLIRHTVNQGPSAGRNAAIKASTAPFLCILDADDFMSEGRLERLLEKGGSDWDLLADDLLFTYGPEAEAFDHLLPQGAEVPRTLTLESFALGNMPRRERPRRELGFLKPLMRRSFLETAGLGYDERLRLGEDFVLYAECLLAGARFRLVEACGYYAVERRNSLSGSHRTDDIAALLTAMQEMMARMAASGRDPSALAPNAGWVRRNLAFRRLLDAKRSGRWAAALAAFADTPRGAVYITSEIVRERLRRWSDRGAPGG